MKILTVVGARPQFIKAAPVCRALREAGHREFLVHTGQHYDYGMSQVFFEELGIPQPDMNLEIGSGAHGWQTGQMLIRLEEVLLAERPDWVLVYGDTNSTLAGALAAVKLRIPVAHVEAGLRSHNREMPEEHNRVLTDHIADLLLCPTQVAVDNLARENITAGVHLVGDTMYDSVLQFAALARQRSTILDDLGLTPKGYLLATIHRPYNTDVPENLRAILSAFGEIEEPVIFPVHPRTRRDRNGETWGWISIRQRTIRASSTRSAIWTCWRCSRKPAFFSPIPAGCRRKPTGSACRASPCGRRPSGSKRSPRAGMCWSAPTGSASWMRSGHWLPRRNAPPCMAMDGRHNASSR